MTENVPFNLSQGQTTMTKLPEVSTARKRASLAKRLPNPDPLTLRYAARKIATRYNVGLPMAALVAELINTSLGDRR
jgi:hypothetical protein